MNISDKEKRHFDEEGYLVVKGLFSEIEVNDILETFMEIHAGGAIKDSYSPIPISAAGGDLLKVFPRMINPHRFNEKIFKYLIHYGIMSVLARLFNAEPLASQSMFYFKPPGAKGQALHQDNYYLQVEPGTCIAAWVAIDGADQENGGIFVVPKTNNLEIQCPHEANPELSFTTHEVNIPAGLTAIPINLDPGDTLFFNGNIIHGSYPNKSLTRFRRSFICHYCDTTTTKVIDETLYNYKGEITTRKAGNLTPCGVEFGNFTDKQYY